MKIYIIDSSAVFLRKIHGKAITVPEVVEEIIDDNSRFYFSIMNVRVEDVNNESILNVIETAKNTGDIYRLSDTDIKVIAKALEIKRQGFKPVIVTDDYSIQNVAKILKIEVETVVHPGISKAFKWVKVCSGCGKRVNSNIDVCPICGSKIILRRVKSEKARRPRPKGKKVKGEGANNRRNC